MKQIMLLMTAACFLAACNDEKKAEEGATDQATISSTAEAPSVTVTMPYTASYSASFRLGSGELATKAVQGSWKDWETNNLDNLRSWVADSIVVISPNNKRIVGLDSLIADWKRGRAMYKEVYDTINAVVPIYSVDKQHDWVLVAATEISVDQNGVRDTSSLMENWRFNKDGKADRLFQYDRKTRK